MHVAYFNAYHLNEYWQKIASILLNQRCSFSSSNESNSNFKFGYN
jgi:hypothetical protein